MKLKTGKDKFPALESYAAMTIISFFCFFALSQSFRLITKDYLQKPSAILPVGLLFLQPLSFNPGLLAECPQLKCDYLVLALGVFPASFSSLRQRPCSEDFLPLGLTALQTTIH